MADLEEHAFRRDRRFIVRLVLALGVGLFAGLFAYGKLTSDRTARCSADAFVHDQGDAGVNQPRPGSAREP